MSKTIDIDPSYRIYQPEPRRAFRRAALGLRAAFLFASIAGAAVLLNGNGVPQPNKTTAGTTVNLPDRTIKPKNTAQKKAKRQNPSQTDTKRRADKKNLQEKSAAKKWAGWTAGWRKGKITYYYRIAGPLTVKVARLSDGKRQTIRFDDAFTMRMAQLESTFQYWVSNRLGYQGLFQIGELACVDIKWCARDKRIGNNDFSRGFTRLARMWNVASLRGFQDNVSAQKAAMREYTRRQSVYIHRYGLDERYIGRTIRGVKITRARLLAAAHLVGARKLALFLRSNGRFNPRDGNKKTIRDRMLEIDVRMKAPDYTRSKPVIFSASAKVMGASRGLTLPADGVLLATVDKNSRTAKRLGSKGYVAYVQHSPYVRTVWINLTQESYDRLNKRLRSGDAEISAGRIFAQTVTGVKKAQPYEIQIKDPDYKRKRKKRGRSVRERFYAVLHSQAAGMNLSEPQMRRALITKLRKTKGWRSRLRNLPSRTPMKPFGRYMQAQLHQEPATNQVIQVLHYKVPLTKVAFSVK